MALGPFGEKNNNKLFYPSAAPCADLPTRPLCVTQNRALTRANPDSAGYAVQGVIDWLADRMHFHGLYSAWDTDDDGRLSR